MAVVGRVIGFLGIAAALIAGTIWIVVGILAFAAAPLCTECMQAWLPPVALGTLGALGPLMLWSVTLIVAWRHWSLLLWSLLGWPILGSTNVRALEWFATLFNT